MISYLTRRIAGRVMRRLTGEDREPVGMVSDRDFELAGYALTFTAGVCFTVIACTWIYISFLEQSCS